MRGEAPVGKLGGYPSMDPWEIVHERANMKEIFQAKPEKQAAAAHDGDMLRTGNAGLTLCPFSLNHNRGGKGVHTPADRLGVGRESL